jgi:1-acyl-sn-glycerol-3-phosphate acyltransferase
MTAWLATRALAFYAGYVGLTIVWACVSLAVAWMLPLRARFAFVAGVWSRAVLGWLRVTCGIRYRVSGREHIPDEPCVVLVRHESSWEIPVLQLLFAPQATLLKRELMQIPFFGWGLRLAKPIPIDRGDPRKALRTLMRVGTARLIEGVWVVLFPEGTRMPVGSRGKFHIGGAALAETSGRPVLIVAHNAGRFWPPHRFLKFPGTVEVVIAPSIATAGKSSREINALAYEAIGRPVSMLVPDDYRDEVPSILERVRRGERISHYETVRRTKNGRLLSISLTVSPVRDREGTIVGASAVGGAHPACYHAMSDSPHEEPVRECHQAIDPRRP